MQVDRIDGEIPRRLLSDGGGNSRWWIQDERYPEETQIYGDRTLGSVGVRRGDILRGFGFPGAEDLGNMFQLYRDFEDYFSKSREIRRARSLNPQFPTFKECPTQNKSRIGIG